MGRVISLKPSPTPNTQGISINLSRINMQILVHSVGLDKEHFPGNHALQRGSWPVSHLALLLLATCCCFSSMGSLANFSFTCSSLQTKVTAHMSFLIQNKMAWWSATVYLGRGLDLNYSDWIQSRFVREGLGSFPAIITKAVLEQDR